MNLYRLKQFVQMNGCETMTEAAKEMGISRSALSQSVSSLEQELGCQLLFHKARKLEFTSQGEVVLKYAMKILAEYEELQNLVNIYQKEDSILHVASPSILAYEYLTAEYIAEHSTRITNHIPSVDSDIAGKLLAGEADIGISFCPGEKEGIKSLFFLDVQRYAIVPPDSPLVGKKGIYLEELAGKKLYRNSEIQSSEYYIFARLYDQAVDLNQLGIEIEYVNFATMRILWPKSNHFFLMSTLGFLLNSELEHLDPARVLPVLNEGMRHTLYLLYPEDSGEKTEKFVRWFQIHFSKNSPFTL